MAQAAAVARQLTRVDMRNYDDLILGDDLISIASENHLIKSRSNTE